MASEDAILAQRLECSLCFELMTEPKLLSCSHTFCKNCLTRLYKCQKKKDTLSCPTCRQITQLQNGDVSKLQTNFPIKAMVGDLHGARRICTVCDPDAKSIAASYCQTCGEYLCESCLEAHGKYRKNADHGVFSMDDIKMGSVKVKRICHEHLHEEKLWMCTSCNISICLKCRMLEHDTSRHKIETVSEFQESIQHRVESLQKRASEKVKTFGCHTRLVREQVSNVEDTLEKKKAEIEKIYNESIQQLTKNKDNLIRQYDEYKQTMTNGLCNILENNNNEVESINSLSELVGKGVKKLLEGGNAALHVSLCSDLDDILRREDPNNSECINISKQAEDLRFIRYTGERDLELGQVIGDWSLEKYNTISLSVTEVWDIHPLPTGGMALGHGWGLEIVNVDGSKKTVMHGTKAYRVSAMCDGRFVVRHNVNDITLYTHNWEILPIIFITMNDSRGGGMCADRYNNIYVGYSDYKKIDVFRPEGGVPIMVIPCHDYESNYICHMNHSKLLLVRDTTTVRMIDEDGIVRKKIMKDDINACPVILKDDSIIIGWIKGSMLLSIDLYTPQLKFERTVLTNFPIKNSSNRVNFGEMPTGEIVFTDDCSLHVFRKSRVH